MRQNIGFEMAFETLCLTFDGERYTVPNLLGGGREGTTSKLGFGPGSMEKELARGMKHTAELLN